MKGGRQIEFRYKKDRRGGPRKGAGRPPKGERAGVAHEARPRFGRRMPVHVTVRMADWVWNLRSGRAMAVLKAALYRSADRFGLRVVQFAVLGNHMHLLVEVEHTAALVRGMRGLSIRIARGLNRLMSRSGRVIGDRYHSRVLRTPTEVRRAVHYIRHNHRRHLAELGQRLPATWIDPFCSDCPTVGIILRAPRTWLVRQSRPRAPSRPPPVP